MDRMLPADELAWVREEMGRLARREAELRARFVDGSAPLAGDRAQVTVRPARRAVFRRERLPADLLSDPRYWDAPLTYAVTVAPIGTGRPAPEPAGGDTLTLFAAE